MPNTVKAFGISTLKNDLKENDSRILIERISENYMEEVIKLATEVFTNEKRIPAELIPVNNDLKPIWWCARVGKNIIGITKIIGNIVRLRNICVNSLRRRWVIIFIYLFCCFNNINPFIPA